MTVKRTINPAESYPVIGELAEPGLTTPYSRSEEELGSLLGALTRGSEYLLLDNTTNPDMGTLSVYKVDSKEPIADIGRSLEATVFCSDYGYSNEFIEEHFKPYDGNSFFLLAVDRSITKPTVTGVLRVIDCSKGDSETASMFKEFYGEEAPLPKELDFDNSRGNVWDVFTVVVDHEYRNGLSSVWLYHALYKQCIKEGIERWVSNITPKEAKNLTEKIGVPFKPISGVNAVYDVLPNGKNVEYGFYCLYVEEIEFSVEQRIKELEQKIKQSNENDAKYRFNQFLLHIAKMALWGSIEN